MDVRELSQREPFLELTAATLGPAFGQMFGRDYQLRVDGHGEQQWLSLPPLHGFFTRDAGAEVRRFLKNGFRHTAVNSRRIPQFVLGTLLGGRYAMRSLGRPVFSVSPGVPNAAARLVMPGNQRYRIFDFDTWTTRVIAKNGFGNRGVAGEIRFRSRFAGPFLPLLRSSSSLDWYEEPLVDGYPVARCPPWLDAAAAVRAAREQLATFAEQTARDVDRREYVDAIASKLERSDDLLGARFAEAPRVGDPVRRLRALAVVGPRELRVAQSHGDLQDGNILIVPHSNPVIIDWEHAGERSRRYDEWVYTLGTRRFRRRSRLVAEGERVRSAEAAEFAVFLLEEAHFYMGEALSGPFSQLPATWSGFVADLNLVADILCST
ncbi:MAG: phosphotransferase [Polyangiaceae bacterium]